VNITLLCIFPIPAQARLICQATPLFRLNVFLDEWQPIIIARKEGQLRFSQLLCMRQSDDPRSWFAGDHIIEGKVSQSQGGFGFICWFIDGSLYLISSISHIFILLPIVHSQYLQVSFVTFHRQGTVLEPNVFSRQVCFNRGRKLSIPT
jgi:hypothetical protein